MDDDGWLHYAGRSPAKELIKTGGENVYPAEVEAALRAHDAVTDAIVFGLPDERWGERVVAVVVRGNAPATNAPDEATLRTFVATRIAPYKRPARIAFADDLPKGANGLVDRVAVKERFGGRL